MFYQNILSLIEAEKNRQKNGFNLIASENICPQEILDITNNCLGNKYAEGQPNNRFYSGCRYIDQMEELSINECCELFEADYANIQAHSGSQANLSAYLTLLKPGDKILSMNFASGGHLTHGHSLNISSKLFSIETYNVNIDTEILDYKEVLEIAKKVKPNCIISGASSYSRIIDYEEMWKIAKEVGAYHIADIAHVAGLIAAKLITNPFPFADLVTSTTHKTLRGCRGGFVLCKKEFSEKLNRVTMPGIQGGPFMNVIVGKGLTFNLAKKNDFVDYQKQVIQNVKILSELFIHEKFKVISNGTDTHLFLIDTVKSFDLNGFDAEKILEKNNIYVNRNCIPFDSLSPRITSGIRLGTPFITSQNISEKELLKLGKKIITLLKN